MQHSMGVCTCVHFVVFWESWKWHLNQLKDHVAKAPPSSYPCFASSSASSCLNSPEEAKAIYLHPHPRYPSSEISISLAPCRTVPSKPSLTTMALSCCCSWGRSPRSSFHHLTWSEKYSEPTISFSSTAQKPPPPESFSTATRTSLSIPTAKSGDRRGRCAFLSL